MLKGAEMFDKVKAALRITHNKLDNEIQDVINAAMQTLQTRGINAVGRECDPLILNAVTLYAKWQMNYQDKSEQFKRAWDSALIMLALSGDYNE